MERNLEGNKIAIVEVIKKGNELRVVTYFNDSSSGRTNPAYNMSRLDDTSETGQLQSTYLNKNISQDTDNVKMKLGERMSDKFGNEFTELDIPVSSLRRNKDFQPRTTASGKGTSDSVFKYGYDEGRVDQKYTYNSVLF